MPSNRGRTVTLLQRSLVRIVGTIKIALCFSTGAPRNLGVPPVPARGSTETHRHCLGRISQPQFYAVVAIPLVHGNLATMYCIENSVQESLLLIPAFVLRHTH